METTIKTYANQSGMIASDKDVTLSNNMTSPQPNIKIPRKSIGVFRLGTLNGSFQRIAKK